MSPGDQDRAGLLQDAVDLAPLPREPRGDRLEGGLEGAVGVAEPTAVVAVQGPDLPQDRGPLFLGQGVGADPQPELVVGGHEVFQADPVEALQVPDLGATGPVGRQEGRVLQEEPLRALVEPEVEEPAPEVALQGLQLPFPLLPPGRDGHHGPGDAEQREGVVHDGGLSLRAEEDYRGHADMVGRGTVAPSDARAEGRFHVHVIFVEPRFPTYQREFVRGLREVGAVVTGIGEAPVEALDDEVKGWLHAYEQVPSVVNEDAMLETVRRIQSRGWVDRLEATIEAHIMPAAHVRAATGIPGTSVETAWLCRDKPSMKEALREAGIPTAASTGAASAEEVRAFVAEVGYPVVLKPRSAAGAAGTVRADDDESLELAIVETQVDRGAPVAVEEFVEGHEGFYDTICIGGQPVHEFISHYYPPVLEAMRTRWISPQIVTTNRLDAPGYEEVRAMGTRVIHALGIETSATHMEWFFGPKGLKFSEIGCRPPGVAMWDLYCAAHEMDLYREWAMAVAHGRPAQHASRGFAAGMVNVRPSQDGQIVAYEGMDDVQRRCGEWILDSHLPPVGSPTMPVESGYKANAWLRLRHPDYDELRSMLDFVGERLKVIAR